MPKPTVTAQSCCLEAARASALASHSGASLCAAAGLREAARLLRSSEALARAAVATLLAPPKAGASDAAGGDPPVGPYVAVPQAPARRRRRKNRSKVVKSERADVDDMAVTPTAGVGVASGTVCAASCPATAGASEGVSSSAVPLRALQARLSRERSPRGSTTSASLPYPDPASSPTACTVRSATSSRPAIELALPLSAGRSCAGPRAFADVLTHASANSSQQKKYSKG